MYELASKAVEITLEKDILKTLDELYIEARYPGELGLLSNGKPTIDDSNVFLDFAKMVYSVVKDILERE